MNFLCENTFIRAVFEKMEKQKLQLLTKHAVEIIQSFLVLVPPMVVDCSLHPDIKSGAYSSKKVAGSTSAHCVTTQSALFYSYKGESTAKPGEYASMDSIGRNFLVKNFAGDYPLTSVQTNCLLQKEISLPLQKAPEENQEVEKPEIQQSEDKNNSPSKHSQKQEGKLTEVELLQEIQKSIHESHQRQLQKIKEFTARQKEDVRQELRTLLETNQEMNSTIKMQDQEIRYLQTVSLDDPSWVIESDDIQMTQDVIGNLRGGWGEVRVGNFRGTRVVVKHIHSCKHNPVHFSREMDIAGRIHHPNILQFIGATRGGNLMMLIEFIPTSLREVLNKKVLVRPQMLHISRNIAAALNYLHLWRPEPIIHQDIASSNVLLEQSGHSKWKAKLSDYGSAYIEHLISFTDGPSHPAYVAPESCNPIYHYSTAGDVYSFGVLLLEMVVNHAYPPRAREHESLIQRIPCDSMKTLIQWCTTVTDSERPTMAQVLQYLR